MKIRSVCLMLLTVWFFASSANAQTTVTLGGGAGVTCPALPTATWTTPPTGVTFSNWSRGAGVTCASAANGLSGSGFNSASAAAGYSANKYYSVTITADATHSFTLNSLTWVTQLSGSTNSCNFTVKYSNNGGAVTDFGTAGQSIVSSGAATTFTFTAGSTVTVAAGTAIVMYMVPHQATAAGTTVRWVNGSTFNVTASSVSSTPTLTWTNTSGLVALSTTEGTASTTATASIGGSNLVGNVTVTAPVGFEVSQSSGTGFGSTTVVTASGTLSATPIYIRLAAATTAGPYAGNLVASTSDGASGTVSSNASMPSSIVSAASLTPTTITWSSIPASTVGQTINLSTYASSNSNAAFTFTSNNTAVATVVGSTATLVGTGSITFTANQAANATYDVGSQTSGSVTVNAASQSITFGALGTHTTAESLTLTSLATASSGLTVSFASSNTSVVVVDVINGILSLVGPGTATITASQAGNSNYTAASDVSQTITVLESLVAWDFTGEGSTTTATSNPDQIASGLGGASGATLSRGSSAAWSTGANSFRTTGFQNNGIATSNTDYFQFSLTPQLGHEVDITTLDARFAGTPTFITGNPAVIPTPGVTAQFAYSIDGGAYTLIGSPFVMTANGAMPQMDVSAISALQNIIYPHAVTFRYFASGNTTTGGWGFQSPTAGSYGLNLGGAMTAYPLLYPSSAVATQLTTVAGTASTNTSFGFDAANLTNNVVITAPAGFEISQSAGSGFATSLTLIPSSGSISTTLYARLAASTAVGIYSGNISFVSAGATTANYVLAAGNEVTPLLNSQTITFNALPSSTYGDADLNLDSYASSDASLPLTYVSSNTSVATVSGSTLTIVGVGSTTITASQAGNASYNAATSVNQTLSVGAKTLTVSGANVTDKPYDGTATATITGSLVGVVGSDAVSLGGNGTFASTAIGSNISVTANLTLTGAQATNYLLTQPTGLTGNIITGVQTITFNALALKSEGDLPFTLTLNSSAGLPVTYTSSNTSVATVTGNTVTIVGAGSTTINANQAGDANYGPAAQVSQTLTVMTTISKWSFDGIALSGTGSTTPSLTSGSVVADAGAITAGTSFTGLHASASTVWSAPAGNGSSRSLSSTNWAINDYYQFTGSTVGYENIYVMWDQTGSNTGPKNFKFQYSTNGGTSWTDINYSTPTNGSSAYGWSASSANQNSGLSMNLSADNTVTNVSSVIFRLTMLNTTAINGTTVATGGTQRVDRFTVAGTLCPTPAVTISSSDNDNQICSGASVTFTATPTSGGAAPTYAWYVNSVLVAGETSDTYTTTTLPDGASVYCIMTANNACQTTSTATSSSIVTNHISNTFYADIDGDGFGGASTVACTIPVGYVLVGGDCNDNAFGINPSAAETCGNGLDEDCTGADEQCAGDAFTSPVVSATPAQFGLGNTVYTVNFAGTTNSIQSPGTGQDVWYSFVANSNAVRIALSGDNTINDDNDLAIYATPSNPNVQLVPLVSENDVHVGAQGAASDAGDETLIYGSLTVGSTYYLCVRNNNATAGVVKLRINALLASQADIAVYTNNTSTFNNACQNFKAAYKINASSYSVNRFATSTVTGTPSWSYTIPPTTTNKTICQVGKILPTNTSTSTATWYVSVDVNYSLSDAYGNPVSVTAVSTTSSAVMMAAEAALFVRAADQCPVQKSATVGAIFANRAVCGVDHYKWRFQETTANNASNLGLAVETNGPAGAVRQLMMANVPSIADGKWYSVKVAPVHLDGTTASAYSTVGSCVKTLGAAGMPIVETEGEVLSAIQGESLATIYPNPNQGNSVNLNVVGLEGDLNITVSDASGREVYVGRYIVEGQLNTDLDFGQVLSNGIYFIQLSTQVNHTTLRMVVNR